MDQLLIVGGGLAGTVLALQCHERGIGFQWVITDQIPAASFVAYGLCNPVHLRNQVPVWKASELYPFSRSFFSKWSDKLAINAFSPMPVNHLVTDESELVKWRQNSESTELWKYCNGEPEHNIHPLLAEEYMAEIRIAEAFFLNIPLFITQVRSMFRERIIAGPLGWGEVTLTDDQVNFREQVFQKMILADGIGGMTNPFFQCVPFNPCKGQVLHVRIENLVVKEAIHKKIVLLPLNDGTYLCGATYEWTDLSNEVTASAKHDLLEQLHTILGDKYTVEVISHKAGVRPAIADRRPLVGWHPKHSMVGILNGFGTRGLLVGPSTCQNLLNNYIDKEPILNDWNVQRFNKRFEKKGNKS